MKHPRRSQLQRKKGWRMPPNTVSVARPGPFGNPFTISSAIMSGLADEKSVHAFVVQSFRDWLAPGDGWQYLWGGEESRQRRAEILRRLPELTGKNLACFCPIGSPCHADVLIELANKETE